MRVAAIADIHGNLPALQAVLADVEPEAVDAIVVVGDSVTGPFAAETFDLLRSVGARVVRGNADRLEEVERFDEHEARWSEQRLGADRLAEAAAWPLALELELDGLGRALFCHSTPYSDEPIYTRTTPDDQLAEVLGPVAAEVLVCGHTHVQYDRWLPSGLRVVNPGSVGMPYEGRQGAFWAILGPDVEMRRTEYDVDAAVAAIRGLGAPVDEQQLGYLVEPPDPDEVTACFESVRGA